MICDAPFVSHQPVYWISQSALRLAKKSAGLRFPNSVNIYNLLQRRNVVHDTLEMRTFFPDAKGHWPETEISRLMLSGVRESLSGVSHSALRAQERLLPILVCCRAHLNEVLFSGRCIK